MKSALAFIYNIRKKDRPKRNGFRLITMWHIVNTGLVPVFVAAKELFAVTYVNGSCHEENAAALQDHSD